MREQPYVLFKGGAAVVDNLIKKYVPKVFRKPASKVVSELKGAN